MATTHYPQQNLKGNRSQAFHSFKQHQRLLYQEMRKDVPDSLFDSVQNKRAVSTAHPHTVMNADHSTNINFFITAGGGAGNPSGGLGIDDIVRGA
jgi:hypothetical protein